MNDETQVFIDVFKRRDGAMDWYKVLDLPPTATLDQIEISFHILSTTFDPKNGSGDREGAVRFVLVQKAYEELKDPARRKKYDAFCRFEHDHAKLLVAIEAGRQRQKIARTPTGLASLFRRADTRAKRYSLLAAPFFAVPALYRLLSDLDQYDWEPSLSFLVLTMAFVLCLLFSFTQLGNWAVNADPKGSDGS